MRNIFIHTSNIANNKLAAEHFSKTVLNEISTNGVNPNIQTLAGTRNENIEVYNQTGIKAKNDLKSLFPNEMGRFYGSKKIVGKDKPLPKKVI